MDRLEPRIVAAVAAAVVMDLIDIDLAHLWRDGGFDVLVIGSWKAAEIATNLRTKVPRAHESDHTLIVLVVGGVPRI